METKRTFAFTFTPEQIGKLLDHLAEVHAVGLWEDLTYEEATRWHLDLHALKAGGRSVHS